MNPQHQLNASNTIDLNALSVDIQERIVKHLSADGSCRNVKTDFKYGESIKRTRRYPPIDDDDEDCWCDVYCNTLFGVTLPYKFHKDLTYSDSQCIMEYSENGEKEFEEGYLVPASYAPVIRCNKKSGKIEMILVYLNSMSQREPDPPASQH